MFTSIKVKNFRCIDDLTLGTADRPLKRVNLIAGENNSGKTSFLEAAYLHSTGGSPDIPRQLGVWRGLQTNELDFEALWIWLFRDASEDRVIEISSTGTDESKRTLTVKVEPATTYSISEYQPSISGGGTTTTPNPQGHASGASGEADRPRIVRFRYSSGSAVAPEATVSITAGRTTVMQVEPSNVPPSIFFSSQFRPHIANVQRFSELKKRGLESDVVASVARLEPRLKALDVLFLNGPQVYCNLGFRPLVPLPYMGEGFNRFLSIALAIAEAESGVVFIDEIENGVHYSVMSQVWDAIAAAAAANDVQVFATTHSFECIQAAHRAFKSRSELHGQPYDFAYHRMDRVNGHVFAKSFDEEMLDVIERSDFEIR